MDDGMVETVNRAAEAGRSPFYDRARQQNLAPLWRVLGGLVTEFPRSTAVPAIWRYGDVRPYLIEACGLISTEEAERRVLVFENPGLPGQSRITPSLFAGYQIILPGEVAPAHRHVASALRFIIEGKDAYTAVAGERTMMAPGDFVITPSWTWHDHGNESDGPMVWIDGLDMHIVNLLSASFRDSYPGAAHPLTRPEGSAYAEAGSNLLPVDFQCGSQTSPIFNYPYRASREAIHRYSLTRDPDRHHGYKMIYINPVTGGSAMPTLTTALQLLPAGFATAPYRSTAGTIFSVIEGMGTVTIGDNSLEFGPKDLFVAPSWFPLSFSAASEVVLFSYSDRVVQEKLDIFRESYVND
ncbi:gentisate 1,2-dioxygenase [Sphingomonas sp. Root710]|uniref:gentisate 1,2-dioxygenase n=1 Tax=Sphingomonas sp. Root710 TaxID=1736594 RepID=UPI0006FF8ACD|nr:gentisate 1,2-dioxygenase [Sphingomonas sp. Root710]KRB78854.1 gentisate 1,2-dioxygenase [Sphingomonas sp. Root710]